MKKIIILALLALVGYMTYVYFTLPSVDFLQDTIPKETALMKQRDEEYAEKHNGKLPRHMQIVASYSAISDYLKSAVLIGEDDAFFQHEGFDYARMRQALTEDWEKKRFARGASTITQQLAKNVFLSTSKNPIRKFREAILAHRLEQTLEKRRIFEIYLNVIEWGDNVYGAEAAAQYYFGKSASQLNLQEAVVLAAIIPNPRRMNPLANPHYSEYRRGVILDHLYRYHRISETDYQIALNAPLLLRGQTPNPPQLPSPSLPLPALPPPGLPNPDAPPPIKK
ncbi:MAG: monofunctional biosynthetic peptidoglycan transglycosylase [Acidobacteriia bacterium]|nr:monofunctional biosynthetic peptidoglycan transglycosylase [Terriglobia bacterium]